MDDARVQAFRWLKPPCVELSQVALRFHAKRATAKDIINASKSLLEALKRVTRVESALDSKLAEYAFFPLSHIFRENKTVPGRALEIALDCLQILIARGWRGKITPDLAKQLLVLLTFLAGGSATEASSKDVSEELSAAAFACLLSLLQVSDTAGLSSKTKVESANYPVLGHAVSVLLDGIANGPSSKVRLTALDALDALLSSLSDQEALKSFFPGIVSSLTKTLAFSNRPTSPYKIIRGCIQVLDQILLKVVSDESTRESDLNADESSGADSTLVVHNNNKGKGPWLEATSSQVKLALANILPLRYHNKEEVRMALFQLCMSVAGRCTSSLSHSLPMMVETSVVICTQASDTDVTKTMEVMISTMTRHHCLTDILMNCVREWMVALPRIMQSNDDLSKKRTIDQISTAFSIIRPQGVTLDTLDDVIGINLQASVVAAIQTSTANTIQSLPESNKEISPLFHPSSGSNIAETMFNPISQKVIITSLQLLLSQIKGLASSLTLWYKMAESLATTCGNEQLATLWLSIQYLSIPRPKSESDWILRGTRDQKDAQGYILDKIYNFSLSVLSRPTHDSDIDWRLQALALQALTLQACHQGFNFRPELVDALYPILERLGSSNAALQHQAITALSLVSDACGYTSPKELVIENVDYLVNAVAMDLNSYDIRPQAPQVLIMMTRLCGARLISYLDDIIETIFEILGSYHGYPKLVEAMFSVLNTIVEEESKASAAAITERAEPVSRVRNYNPISIQDLATQLREAHIEKPHLDPLPIPPDSEEACHENEEQLSDQPPPSDDPTPLSKSLRTVTSIATLTQHHLPTSSPSLRLLLLRLLPSAFAPLSRHQDTLLPLVNALWPVLIVRLYDVEPYICIAACQALVSLSQTVGDFLATRFDNEWEKLLRLYGKAEREMLVERKAMGRGGVKQRAWEAVAALIAAVIEWVGISGEMEDVVFEVYGVSIQRVNREAAKELRKALEDVNADALWLIEERARLKEGGKVREKPVLEGITFAEPT